MKLTIERTALLNALAHVQSVVERRNTIPILSNVLLEAVDGTLSLTATDMDLAIVEKVAATSAVWPKEWPPAMREEYYAKIVGAPMPSHEEKAYAHLLKVIDERAKNLQEHRGCVAAAADDAALKKCREGMRAFMKEHREEMREHMKEMRERRANKKKKSESTEASS